MILLEKLSFLYNSYVLAVVTIGYILGELGHYLIGITSKQTAIELDYGDHACQQNNSLFMSSQLDVQCSSAAEEARCYELNHNGTGYCEWNYNGLGIDYQLLAGPSFILVFTIMGVVLGILADRYHRVRMLTVCTVIFAVAIFFQGSVQTYWQLVVLRMVMAAGESGCNPLATGILSDIFPEEKRALVMAIFNWGIYGGGGIAFPVGRYVTKLNIWGLGWRICYYAAGVLALIMAALTGATLKEPKRQTIGEENTKQHQQKVSLWQVLSQPRVIMLAIAASIRHCGGMTFAYNADLYYNVYYPDVDLGWWLFCVTVGFGSIGVVVGGIVSDKIVAKMGIQSRVAVLAISQLIATPFAFGSVYFGPLWALVNLGISYFFAEMWFGIAFAIVVEIVPLQIRSTTVGLFLFAINNIGGNLPIAVDPVAKAIGYRESLWIFYPGLYLISSVLFLITMFLMRSAEKESSAIADPVQVSPTIDQGHDNTTFADETGLPYLSHRGTNGNAPSAQYSLNTVENSRL